MTGKRALLEVKNGMAKAKATRSEVQQSLLDQLERNGTDGAFYADLVMDYMALYDTKSKLEKDIKKRGVKIEIKFASGEVKETKTNDSVADLLKVNAQMLKIVSALGLDPTRVGGDGPDDDDEL